jgi:putative ABC transport system permease protein
MAVVLLVGAGLLMRSFIEIASVHIGIETSGVQTFNLSLPQTKYPTPASRAAFLQTLRERLAAHPGVEAAGAIFGMPLTGFNYVISMSTLDGRQITDNDEQMRRSLQIRIVTPEYFRAMGIPIRRGRAIEAGDHQSAPAVVVVNETAARLLWPDADPIGHDFTLGTRMGQGGINAGGVVVGLAGDVHDSGPAQPVRPAVYLSHAQFPVSFFTVVLKARGEPSALVAPSRQLLAQLDAELPMFQVRTADQLAVNVVAQPRLYLMLLGLFAAAAVLLSAIGIYGVLAHSVTARTREIGIRLALGAPRGQVIATVVAQAGGLAVAGLGIGLLGAAAAGRLIRGQLYGVSPIDALTYLSVAGALAVVALLASWLPARRAASVDPIAALRSE